MSQNVISAYQQYLGRTPNQAEVDYWASTGKSYGELGNAFVNSAEYKGNAANNTDDRFLYRPMDGGTPDLINNPNFREFLQPQQVFDIYSGNMQGGGITPADIAKIDPNFSNAWNNLQKPAAWTNTQTVGGLGGLGGMKMPAPTQPDMMGAFKSMMDQWNSQQQSMMDKWGQMAGFNQPKDGPGSGQWGNFGGNTSPVYRPNQGGDQPRNGWGGPWGASNPFSPSV